MKEFESFQLRLPEMRMKESRTFCFDPDKSEFILGNSHVQKTIRLSEIEDIFNLDKSTYKLREDRENVLPNNSDMMLMAISCDLIVLPSLRKWISSLNVKERKNVCDKTRSAMEVAYNGTNILKNKTKLSKGNQSKFFATSGVFIESEGKFMLKTVGEQSLLGHTTELHSASIDCNGNWNEMKLLMAHNISFPFELYFHNSDDPAQRLSLYAGAGTIAWSAKNYMM